MNQSLKEKIVLAVACVVAFAIPLFAQTVIYRSNQEAKTTALKVGTGINLTISGSTATFASAMPDSIGVGDAIEYDKDDGGVVDAICFIHGRTSSTVYTVKTAAGGTPTATSAPDQNWSIFRAYTKLSDWESGAENTGITAGVRNFDAGNRNLVSNNEQWHVAMYRGSNQESSVSINGWTTLDSTGNYVRLYAPYDITEVGTTQRHAGLEAEPYTRINTGISFADAGTDINLAFRFEGLVWRMEGTFCSNLFIPDALAASRIYVTDCVFYGRNGSGCAGTTAGITAATDFNGKIFIKNTIFYNFDGSGNNSGAGRHSAIYYVSAAASTGTIYINNCTDNNSNYFIDHEEPQGVVIVKNSISQNGDNTTAFFTAGGAAYHADSNYNLSDKAADAPGANSKNSTSVTFINAAGNNFHLNSGDTGAGNSGTDLSADANLPVTTDIDRGARPVGANTVDMGADEGVLTAAEMNVKGNNVSIADGDATPSASDSTDFGSLAVSSGTRKVRYKIFNAGEDTLFLTDVTEVAVGGTHAADFTVTLAPSDTILAGDSTSFVVQFDPSAGGTRSATLSIANDDSDENPYNWSIQGTGLLPEMNVKGNNTSITDGDASPSASDSTDFGSVLVTGATRKVTYKIFNTGGDVLNISGTPKVVVGGTHAANFTVTTQPAATVAAGDSSSFVVEFDPSATGVRSATLSIANDDADENPYNYSIQGTGITREILVKGNDTEITNGDVSASTADFTSFGTITKGTVSRTFKILNTGTSNLTLSGNPKVALSGSSFFSVTTQPSSPVAGGDSTTTVILFSPTRAGTFSATVSIENDDTDENPYTFLIQGTMALLLGADFTRYDSISVTLVGAGAKDTVWVIPSINGKMYPLNQSIAVQTSRTTSFPKAVNLWFVRPSGSGNTHRIYALPINPLTGALSKNDSTYVLGSSGAAASLVSGSNYNLSTDSERGFGLVLSQVSSGTNIIRIIVETSQ